MVNYFLMDARDRVSIDELSMSCYRDYKDIGAKMLAHFGRSVDPCSIRRSEFTTFRNQIAAKYSPSRLTKTITVCKMMFTWAHDREDGEGGRIEALPSWGKKFKGAGKRAICEAQNGNDKSFSRDELRTLIDEAMPKLKAAILLGANAGFGNMDVSTLPLTALSDGWINFPRPKTGIQRRVPLWPETLEALQYVIDTRPKPATDLLADRLFLTSRGQEMVRINGEGARTDKIGVVFRKLLDDCNCHRPRRGFYGLRHTFETVAGGSRDQVAVDAIMGHADPSMAAIYRSGAEDDRLKAVTDHVRQWLFG